MSKTGSARSDPGALLGAAQSQLTYAHAPYSGFPVAAAVIDDRGRIFTGVNVENASYGLTMCAERVAIFTAIAGGAKRIRAVAVTAEKSRSITPCGACRQVMAEFCDSDTPVHLDRGNGSYITLNADELLPHAFDAVELDTSGGRNPV